MHGSPTSKIDNRALWKNNNYKDLGIIAEPYFDTDFNIVFYLTDTGRCWDGELYSVRDKVNSGFNLHFHSTNEIINALNKQSLPDKIMFTLHPQRWNENVYFWFQELLLQSIKNKVKKYFFVK